jgi:tRNA uridine 5-carboxymethylaminomethyl modification enzyme
MEKIGAARARLDAMSLTPGQIGAAGIRISADGNRRSGFDLLAFPDVGFDDVIALEPALSDVPADIRAQVERDALYANYIKRQQQDVAAMKRDEAQAIPADFDYDALNGLSNELKAKLSRVRPATLGQAGRVDGMTPAALTLILARLRQAERKSA